MRARRVVLGRVVDVRLRHAGPLSQPTCCRTALLFRQPSKSSVSNVYVLPFSPGVWRATGAVSLLAMLLLIVQTQWWRAHHGHPDDDGLHEGLHRHHQAPSDHLEVGDCVTFIVGALSQQGEGRHVPLQHLPP